MTDKKIHQIEEMISHQEKQILELNDVVTRQWQEIDKLKDYLKRLLDKVNEIDAVSKTTNAGDLSVSEEAARQKPPHY